MAVPQGLSGVSAIALVRTYANEPTLPVDQDILTVLNRGLEEVERLLGGIFLWGQYPTVNQQTFVQFNNDVMYVESANFSSGATNTSGLVTNSSPLSQGSLVYPMFQLEQGSFMDAAAGFPAVGFGPPQAYFIYQDQGYAPGQTLPIPAAPVFGSLIVGTSTVTSIQCELTYVNPNGETLPSPPTTQTLTVLQNATVLSPQGVSNASGYNVYVNHAGTYWLQNTTPIALGVPYQIPNTPLTSGTAAPVANTATGSGTGGSMFAQLYPSAMIGQVNIYYRARPLLWTSTETGTDFTNLDSSVQEAAILYGVRRVLAARGRSGEAAQVWKPEFDQMIESMKETIKMRTRPRSGRVRDVQDRSFPSAPWWMTG